MIGNNICDCNDNEAYIELADGSKLWYSFQDGHTKEKSMESTVKKLKIEDVQFDFIIFNLGNPPRYDLSRLRGDLESLNHSDKPVLYISQGKFQDQVNREATDAIGGMEQFRKMFPNVVMVSEKGRIAGVDQDAVPLIQDHYCMPGPVAHHALNMFHFVN